MQNTPPRASSPAFVDVVNTRFSRRSLLKMGGGALALAGAAPLLGPGRPAVAEVPASTLGFRELPRVYDNTHHVADGYRADVLLRWGDKVAAGAPDFDPASQTAASQGMQAGYNNDHVSFMPLPLGSQSSDRGILVVNNEYPSYQIMFPGLVTTEDDAGKAVSREQADIGLAAMGLTSTRARTPRASPSFPPHGPTSRRTGFPVLPSWPSPGWAAA